jgi:hypothetical protein
LFLKIPYDLSTSVLNYNNATFGYVAGYPQPLGLSGSSAFFNAIANLDTIFTYVQATIDGVQNVAIPNGYTNTLIFPAIPNPANNIATNYAAATPEDAGILVNTLPV